MLPKKPGPVLICPECRERDLAGSARIGNNRSRCGMCNRFHQAVNRRTLKYLKATAPQAVGRAKAVAESTLYGELVERMRSEASDGA